MTVLHGMQKEQFSSFEKLETVVDDAQHVHVEIRTKHTRSLIENLSYDKFINAGINQPIQCMFGMQDFMISGYKMMNRYMVLFFTSRSNVCRSLKMLQVCMTI